MISHRNSYKPLQLLLASLVITISFELPRSALAQNGNAEVPVSVRERLDTFYIPNEVQSIHLRIAENDLQRMLNALPERIYVRASFQWRDFALDNVAVRFKGNSSIAPSQQHKRSFLVKFDEYNKDQRFLGLQRVSFDNGVQFGSLFSEPIITEILRDQGIKTQRCNYAKLYVNDEYRGVYVNVERIDETFLERNFPESNGPLYKVDEGGPGGNLEYLGDEWTTYKGTFQPENRVAKRDQKRLIDFIKAINQSKAEEIEVKLEKALELDDFLRVMAVMLYSGAFDQLTGWNPHNYYLYFDTTHDRWRYMPWDLDVGFCEVAFEQIRVLSDWNAAWPVAGQQANPLIDRIVSNPNLLRRYRDISRTIADKYFQPERLNAVIDAKYKLIKQDLESDPFPHKRVTNREDQSYDDIVASMKVFVGKRYVIARQQLDNPGRRPEKVSSPAGPSAGLAAKVQRIMRAAEKLQRTGKDVKPIQQIMQDVGPLLQKGRQQEAENLVDKALKLAENELGRDQ